MPFTIMSVKPLTLHLKQCRQKHTIYYSSVILHMAMYPPMTQSRGLEEKYMMTRLDLLGFNS